MAKFDETIRKQLKVGNIDGKEDLVVIMDEETVAALNKVNSMANVELLDLDNSIAKAINIADAIANMIDPGSNDYSIVADAIRITDPITQETKMFPCAVCKLTGIYTSKIGEAVVTKLYAGIKLTGNDNVMGFKSGVSKFTTNFKKREVTNSDVVIKTVKASEITISSSIFIDDLRDEHINAIVEAQDNLKRLMLKETLAEVGAEANHDTILALLRNVNRSKADDIFDAVFAVKFGDTDVKSARQVQRYVSLKKNFHKSLATIGKMYATEANVKFGLWMGTMSISPEVKWSNKDKLNRVKQFDGGSYYVFSRENLGLETIPVTKTVWERYMGKVYDITYAALAYVEREARLQVGEIASEKYLPANLELPEIDDIGDLDYAAALGLSMEEYLNYECELESALKHLAEDIVESKASSENQETLDAFRDVFEKK